MENLFAKFFCNGIHDHNLFLGILFFMNLFVLICLITFGIKWFVIEPIIDRHREKKYGRYGYEYNKPPIWGKRIKKSLRGI